MDEACRAAYSINSSLGGGWMSQRRRFSLCTSCDPLHLSTSVAQLHDASHAQTGKYKNVERSQSAFDSTDKHHNLSIFQWRVWFLVGRMSREFNTYHTIVRFLFSLPEGLSPNEAIFLGQTPAARGGALLCDLLAQFRYSATRRVAHRLFE